jgi:hypothetical protein
MAGGLLLVTILAAVVASVWWLLGAETSAPLSTSRQAPSGTETMVTIDDDGSLQAEEHVSFAAPQAEVHVSVPRPVDVSAGFQPRIENLRVEAAGQTMRLGRTLGPGDSATVQLPTAARDVRVLYSASGTVVRSKPSAPGRRLALLTPLVIQQAEGLSFHMEVSDRRVLNLGCTTGDTMTVCGATSKTGWTVERPDRRGDVLAQLDLRRSHTGV